MIKFLWSKMTAILFGKFALQTTGEKIVHVILLFIVLSLIRWLFKGGFGQIFNLLSAIHELIKLLWLEMLGILTGKFSKQNTFEKIVHVILIVLVILLIKWLFTGGLTSIFASKAFKQTKNLLLMLGFFLLFIWDMSD